MLDYFSQDLETILNKTKDSWSDKKNKTFFITGGTGFFGIWFQMSFVYINRNLNLNSKLIVLTRDKVRFWNKFPWFKDFNEITYVEGDVVDFDFVNEKIDFVVHAATEASNELIEQQPTIMFNTIVNGTKRVLDLAKNNVVEGFLMTSSGAVYGNQPRELSKMPESFLGSPRTNDYRSVYGEGKRMAEVLCSIFYQKDAVPVKIARCYSFLGPFLSLDGHFAAGNFVRSVVNGEDIVISGDGTSIRSYMYPADLMIWLWTILFKGACNEPYNVGSETGVAILELANKICELNNGVKSNVIINDIDCENRSTVYVPNVEKAKNELGLSMATSLNRSISKTLAFLHFIKGVKN